MLKLSKGWPLAVGFGFVGFWIMDCVVEKEKRKTSSGVMSLAGYVSKYLFRKTFLKLYLFNDSLPESGSPGRSAQGYSQLNATCTCRVRDNLAQNILDSLRGVTLVTLPRTTTITPSRRSYSSASHQKNAAGSLRRHYWTKTTLAPSSRPPNMMTFKLIMSASKT